MFGLAEGDALAAEALHFEPAFFVGLVVTIETVVLDHGGDHVLPLVGDHGRFGNIGFRGGARGEGRLRAEANNLFVIADRVIGDLRGPVDTTSEF